MKHISFDESTVLNELARIASETGLIKTAQTTVDVPEALRKTWAQADPRTKVLLDGLEYGLNALAKQAGGNPGVAVQQYANKFRGQDRNAPLEQVYPVAKATVQELHAYLIRLEAVPVAKGVTEVWNETLQKSSSYQNRICRRRFD